MFNRKIKKRLHEFEEQLEKLTFIIENKPKFNVGNSINEILIIERKFIKKEPDIEYDFLNFSIPGSPATWFYKCFNTKTQKIIDCNEKKLIKMTAKPSKSSNSET